LHTFGRQRVAPAASIEAESAAESMLQAAALGEIFFPLNWKDQVMNIPPEVKPGLWGAVAGAIVVAILGFTWGGWVTKSSAETQASQRASAAVVAALSPICVDKFRQAANATESLVELKKTNTWSQGSFVEKGGWATMPGSAQPDSSVARACAEKLTAT
jgi:hypothetical protein